MKNNKGFFLAETIVMIALVTTIMAFVYPNVSKLYENYKNRVMYYDQTEDLYTLRALYEKNKTTIDNKTKDESGKVGCKNINCSPVSSSSYCWVAKPSGMNFTGVYIFSYMSTPSSDNYNFNKYLKRLKKSTNDTSAYRLVGVIGVDTNNDGLCDSNCRYASIKIDNPNPNRSCN